MPWAERPGWSGLRRWIRPRWVGTDYASISSSRAPLYSPVAPPAARRPRGSQSRAPSGSAARNRMVLCELRVENLLLIEEARLELAPGLNVLTGETGAGKTVLAHALDLLLGGRAKPGIVRPGAAEAYVEGTFELSAGVRATLRERIAPIPRSSC